MGVALATVKGFFGLVRGSAESVLLTLVGCILDVGRDTLLRFFRHFDFFLLLETLNFILHQIDDGVRVGVLVLLEKLSFVVGSLNLGLVDDVLIFCRGRSIAPVGRLRVLLRGLLHAAQARRLDEVLERVLPLDLLVDIVFFLLQVDFEISDVGLRSCCGRVVLVLDVRFIVLFAARLVGGLVLAASDLLQQVVVVFLSRVLVLRRELLLGLVLVVLGSSEILDVDLVLLRAFGIVRSLRAGLNHLVEAGVPRSR